MNELGKATWNYNELVAAYANRPDYAPSVFEQIFRTARVQAGMAVCDMGAGVGHSTLHLARFGLRVAAVEPSPVLREFGRKRCSQYTNVQFCEGSAEATGFAPASFRLVTFGSSFELSDTQKALAETSRVLKRDGWVCCISNHRNLQDPLQAEIEKHIQSFLPSFRSDSAGNAQAAIEDSGLFNEAVTFSGSAYHTQNTEDCVQGWYAHVGLQRQAGTRFAHVIEGVEALLRRSGKETVEVPYTTRVCMAQKDSRLAS
jgi:ubiquinone/menaquinone biosynthesis C-methylase UbiE